MLHAQALSAITCFSMASHEAPPHILPHLHTHSLMLPGSCLCLHLSHLTILIQCTTTDYALTFHCAVSHIWYTFYQDLSSLVKNKERRKKRGGMTWSGCLKIIVLIQKGMRSPECHVGIPELGTGCDGNRDFLYLLPDDVYFSETKDGAKRVHNCASQCYTTDVAVCGHLPRIQHIVFLQPAHRNCCN